MRIAWFTHRYYPCIGGAENFGRAMVRRFVAAGAAVDVVTSDAHDLWYFNDRRRRRLDAPAESWVDGARVRRLAVRHIPLQRHVGRLLSCAPHWPTRCQVAAYMPIIPGLGRVRGAYDAVCAVGFPYTVFSYAALRTARAAGAPLVLIPFLHLARPGDRVHRRCTRSHQIRLLAEAQVVVVVTRLEADAVAGWGIPRDRIFTLPMAVDHAEVTGGIGNRLRNRLGIPHDRKVVGHLATLDPNKGTNDLVLALERLNAARPARDPIALILAGVSSPDFEEFATHFPAATRRWLIQTGPLSAEQKADFYAAIDVFAMPSRTDSYGIVFLESWANAKPVVAAEAGGVAEVVAHDRTGLLVPFGDPARLAQAIDRLLADPGKARALGEAGHALVSHGFTWDDRFAAFSDRVRTLVASCERPWGQAG
ncbi:MAG TPA: glycosyltransferase family 4 protein [Isosphaeraceae bacterium]|jgi:glycosyltransferase involved in cell wall biosynthesis